MSLTSVRRRSISRPISVVLVFALILCAAGAAYAWRINTLEVRGRLAVGERMDPKFLVDGRTGNLTMSGGIAVDTNKFTVAGASPWNMVLGDSSAGINAAGGATMQYTRYMGVTTPITGTGLAVRGRAQQKSIDSTGALVGGQFEAGNGSYSGSGDGGNIGVLRGIYCGTTTSTAGGSAKTVGNARGLELNLDWDQADTTITNGAGIWCKFNAGSTGATHGTVHGIVVDNEAVGGTGQQFDSGFLLSDTNMSGGVKGWAYGLDLSGATINTADILLQNSEKIYNTTDGVIGHSGQFQSPYTAAKTVADTSDTLTSADYGYTIFYSSSAAISVTLPANGAAAGASIRCINIADDTTNTITYTAATADTLIGPNDVDLDDVKFATGERIGSCVRFLSTGTYWVAINEGSTTMTQTD